jgi:hypothetical protein
MDSLYQFTSYGIGSKLMENVNQAKNLVIENFAEGDTSSGFMAVIMAIVIFVLWLAIVIGYFYLLYKAVVTAIAHTENGDVLMKIIHVGFAIFQPVLYLIAYHIFFKKPDTTETATKYVLSTTPAL